MTPGNRELFFWGFCMKSHFILVQKLLPKSCYLYGCALDASLRDILKKRTNIQNVSPENPAPCLEGESYNQQSKSCPSSMCWRLLDLCMCRETFFPAKHQHVGTCRQTQPAEGIWAAVARPRHTSPGKSRCLPCGTGGCKLLWCCAVECCAENCGDVWNEPHFLLIAQMCYFTNVSCKMAPFWNTGWWAAC